MVEDIPEKLINKTISCYNENKESWLEFARTVPGESRYLTFPVMIDGRIGLVRYDRREDCLELEITICMTVTNSGSIFTLPGSLYDDAALADTVEYITIALDEEE
jgi:hypothetical protein